MANCPHGCGADVQDNEEYCPCCGEHAGFPNVKMAEGEKRELLNRLNQARDNATRAGSFDQLEAFEQAVGGSSAVVNVDPGFLSNFIVSDKPMYATYGRLVDAGARVRAAPEDDSQRTSVEGLLFGSHAGRIAYAALALDGVGLISYGSISLQLKEKSVAARASLLEENSYDFIQRHHVVPGTSVPKGYRATWPDRSRLAVAKVAGRVTSATTAAEHPSLLLHSTGDRSTDSFVEVHIWGPFNRQAIDRITVHRGKVNAVDKLVLDVTRSRTALKIPWEER